MVLKVGPKGWGLPVWPDIPEGRVESIVFHLHPAAESELTHPPRAKSVQLESCSIYMYMYLGRV